MRGMVGIRAVVWVREGLTSINSPYLVHCSAGLERAVEYLGQESFAGLVFAWFID